VAAPLYTDIPQESPWRVGVRDDETGTQPRLGGERAALRDAGRWTRMFVERLEFVSSTAPA